MIRWLGPPLVSTPRSAKRLANSYGLLAAIRRLTDPDSDADPLPAMILLAAVVAYPGLGPALLTRLHTATRDNPDLEWGTFLEHLPDALANTARAPDTQAWISLTGALTDINDRALAENIGLPVDIAAWANWIPLVGRLSCVGTDVSALGFSLAL
jgi:hypothetical protein